MVPGVVKLGGDPYLLARDARVPNSLANLRLIPVGKSTVRPLLVLEFAHTGMIKYSRVDVTIAGLESSLDSFPDLIRLGLPCSQTNARNFVVSVEGEGGPSHHASISAIEAGR